MIFQKLEKKLDKKLALEQNPFQLGVRKNIGRKAARYRAGCPGSWTASAAFGPTPGRATSGPRVSRPQMLTDFSTDSWSRIFIEN